MAKMGRPISIEINWDKLDGALEVGATLEEVAAQQGCSADIIEMRVKEMHGITYSEYSKQKRVTTHVALRRKQIQLALQGNVPMLIWLGKNKLNQSDKYENKVELIEEDKKSAEQIKQMASILLEKINGTGKGTE